MRRRGALVGIGALAVAVSALAACPTEEKVPGEFLGSFRFTVALVQDGCGYAERPDGGRAGDPEPFVASLSHERTTGRFYLTSGATQLEGTLEGDRFAVEGHASRTLPCGCDASATCGCSGTIVERVEGTVYGLAQVAAGGCGAPAPDAGEPVLRDGGSDVRLVCGFLSDEMKAEGDACTCPACLVVYAITGERQ